MCAVVEGSQAWSSLQDQGNVDLQLLHVTSRGPTEDMTQRLTGQPATKYVSPQTLVS